MGLSVAVLANLKKNAPRYLGVPAHVWDELDSEATTNGIISALESAGHRATFLEGNLSLIEKLAALQPDICFNICEGHWGDSRESHVPSILEMLRIPYTGSGVLSLALTLDKPMTKRVLAFYGLPTPAFQVFHCTDEPVDRNMQFPLFVKPSREGTSMGVSACSVVRDETALRREISEHLDRFHQPVLVERFIRGRELTLGIIGNSIGTVPYPMDDEAQRDSMFAGLRVLPPLEVDLDAYPASEGGVYTNRIKTEFTEIHIVCPASLPSGWTSRLQWLAAAAFRVTHCLDFARVDFRLDADDGDKPYILEVNPLPGLCPGFSDLVLEAEATGLPYNDLINAIFDAARGRVGLGGSRSSQSA
jgi:D-alanine-D-alanine ligase